MQSLQHCEQALQRAAAAAGADRDVMTAPCISAARSGSRLSTRAGGAAHFRPSSISPVDQQSKVKLTNPTPHSSPINQSPTSCCCQPQPAAAALDCSLSSSPFDSEPPCRVHLVVAHRRRVLYLRAAAPASLLQRVHTLSHASPHSATRTVRSVLLLEPLRLVRTHPPFALCSHLSLENTEGSPSQLNPR